MSSLQRKRTILLFGKTGNGKSTIGNKLATGHVDGEFAAGDSMAAVTKQTYEIITKSGNNWTIIDTVGMFATDEPEHDLKRIRELRNYVAEKHKVIDVFCYIKKASKFTRADEECWRAFHALFGENRNYHDNVLLVFTSCRRKQMWLDENRSLISEMMSAPVLPNPAGNSPTHDDIGESNYDGQRVCYRSIGVDFPPKDDESMVESKLENTRSASLKALKSAIEEVKQPLPLCKLPEESESRGFNCKVQCLRELSARRKNINAAKTLQFTLAFGLSMCALVFVLRECKDWFPQSVEKQSLRRN